MMRLSLAQFGATADKAQNLDIIQKFSESAAQAGASMLLLPEYSMFYTVSDKPAAFSTAAESLDGSFCTALSAIARAHGLWICAGMFERSSDARPFNTVVVLNDEGELAGFHRKVKLFDAFGCRESAECRPGNRPFQPIDTPAGRLGLITCFELRFPALAAEQRALGAETLFVPAGWMCGANKVLHWRTLLAARAIENQMTVLGVSQSAEGVFIGHSAAFAPDGTTLGALETQTELLTITL